MLADDHLDVLDFLEHALYASPRYIEQHGHKNVTLVKEMREIPAWLLDRTREGDMVITLGAGSVYRAGEEFLKRLSARGAGS